MGRLFWMNHILEMDFPFIFVCVFFSLQQNNERWCCWFNAKYKKCYRCGTSCAWKYTAYIFGGWTCNGVCHSNGIQKWIIDHHIFKWFVEQMESKSMSTKFLDGIFETIPSFIHSNISNVFLNFLWGKLLECSTWSSPILWTIWTDRCKQYRLQFDG